MISEVSLMADKVGTSHPDQQKPEKTLAETFKRVFEQTEHNLQKADHAVMQANTGGQADLHEMMIAMEKADISLRFMIQVRNKAMDAYQEIMRMQV